VSVLVGVSALADIVYDNTITANGNQHVTSAGWFGDEINLGPGPRKVTQFEFEYFGLAAGTFQVRFYANDGADVTHVVDGKTITGKAPGTLLWDGPSDTILSGFHSVKIDGFSVDVPDTFTWAVNFGGENAGLLLYDPPLPGSSFDDFWQNLGGGWTVNTINNGAVVANFAARVTAVPEPGTVLTLLGGLALVGVVVYRRRQA
jgi:hypothetical protein